MSAEKCFALYYPIKARTVCKVKITKRVSLGEFFIFVWYGTQWLFIVEATLDRFGYRKCVMVNVSKFYKKAFYIISNSVFLFAHCFDGYI